MRLRRTTRRPKRLALRPFLCVSPSSPMSTLTRTHSARCSRRSTRGVPTRSGVSATRSATDRRPNRCCELVSERADICLVGNHDLVALGTLDVEDFNDEAAAAALWTRAGARAALARVLVDARAERRRRRRAAVSRERARPRVGVRDQCGNGIRQPADDRGAARARRAQPRCAGDRSRRATSCTADSRLPAPRSSSRDAGCSIRDRSGSRATAIRTPHGSRSTRMRSVPASTVSPIRSSALRRGCSSPVCPRHSRSGSRRESRKAAALDGSAGGLGCSRRPRPSSRT